jgi:hypothetical protein
MSEGRIRLAVLPVLIVLTACSTSTVTGSATAGSSQASSGTPIGSGTRFSSCHDLTDAQITAFGLDPASKAVTSVQEVNLGTGCSWTSSQIGVGFLVTDQTTQDLAARAGFKNVKPLTVGGRQAVKFELDPPRDCNVGIATGSTAAIVSLAVNFSSIGVVNACVTALDIATKLAPTLPK